MVGIALFFGFITLGTWQVQRRTWKLDLMERVETRLHQPPIDLSQLAGPASAARTDKPIGETYAYQPVQAEGRWLNGKTVFTQALTELGSGFWAITPFQMEDGQIVLVNRGFVPEGQRALALPPAPTEGAATRIEGLLRATEPGGGFLRKNDAASGKWYSRDVAAIGDALGLGHVQPFFIDLGVPVNAHVNAEAPSSASTAQAADPWPRPGMTVVKFHNSHAVYALTWYGLALMVVLAAWLVVRHERQRA